MGIIVLINILLSMLNFKNVTVAFCLHRFFFGSVRICIIFFLLLFLLLYMFMVETLYKPGNNTKESYHFLNKNEFIVFCFVTAVKKKTVKQAHFHVSKCSSALFFMVA